MKFIKPLLLTSLLLTSTAGFATDQMHSIGLGAALGTINSSNEDADIDVSHYNFFYNYNFNKNWAIEVNYLNGDSDTIIGGLASLGLSGKLNQLDYSALGVSAKGILPINKNFHFYGTLGANRYSYDVTKNAESSKVISSESGIDLTATLGAEYKFDSGFGLYVNYRYLKMGSDYKISTYGTGVSFSF